MLGGWYLPVGFIYDPTSGDIYHHQTSEYSKLSRIGLEGRSTTTTVLSLGILDSMANPRLRTEGHEAPELLGQPPGFVPAVGALQ